MRRVIQEISKNVSLSPSPSALPLRLKSEKRFVRSVTAISLFFEWKTDYVGLRCVPNRASEKSDQQKWDGKEEIS